jgi:hypothetical protein
MEIISFKIAAHGASELSAFPDANSDGNANTQTDVLPLPFREAA